MNERSHPLAKAHEAYKRMMSGEGGVSRSVNALPQRLKQECSGIFTAGINLLHPEKDD